MPLTLVLFPLFSLAYASTVGTTVATKTTHSHSLSILNSLSVRLTTVVTKTTREKAALLRAYAVDRIHERDSLVEAALAFVTSTAEAQNNNNGSDAKAVEELMEWRKRLGEESKDLDPGGAVEGKLQLGWTQMARLGNGNKTIPMPCEIRSTVLRKCFKPSEERSSQ